MKRLMQKMIGQLSRAPSPKSEILTLPQGESMGSVCFLNLSGESKLRIHDKPIFSPCGRVKVCSTLGRGKSLIKNALLLVSSLALTACSLGPVATPSVAHYFLQVKQSPKMSSLSSRGESKSLISERGRTILLANIQSAPGYQTSAMHYVITPYQLQAFTTHAWVSPPAKLWQPLLESALQQAGIGMIVHSPTPAQTHYRLDVHLDRFEQNFQKPQSVFMMQASIGLQNVKTGRVMSQKTFSVTVPAQANTPYAGVLAANIAVGEMNQKIAGFLEQRIAR